MNLAGLNRSLLAGMALALALSFGYSLWAFSGATERVRQQAQQRAALMQANALAWLVTGQPPEQADARLRSWRAANAQVESVVVVSGMRMLASTRPEDGTPRQLKREEKPLFDLANSLRAALETNRGEGVVRKKLAELDRHQAGRSVITVPYVEEDRFAGIVQATVTNAAMDHEEQAIGALVPVLLVTAAMLLAGFLGGQPRRPSHAGRLLAVLVLLCVATAQQLLWYQDLDRQDQAANRELGAESLALAGSFRGLGGAALPALPAGNRLDTDIYLRPLGLIGADGVVDEPARAARLSAETRFLVGNLAATDLMAAALLLAFAYGYGARLGSALKRHAAAYAYVAPAMGGMLVLVFFPFIYGITLAFTDTTLFNEGLSFQERWIGLDNFLAILGDWNIVQRGAEGFSWNYQNFYWTLMITVIWTVSNVTIGVTIGFLLALALNTEGLGGKPIYRILLILPWAIPNYITALVWRGMFHPQFGVINQVVQMFGFEPVAWFDGVVSSFLTGLATNGWLSFPFMMVVILGALQSIPREMYEAASVEGASPWQRLHFITLPLLRPTLIPAIVLSVVWTFNMFNVIFLVSGGEPGGANEILITKAYKIAFENYQYAYAAAYSTVIFCILLVYGFFQTRVTRATESY